MRSVRLLLLIWVTALPGCVFSSVPADPSIGGGSVRVEGRVVDLVTGQPIAGTAVIATSGLVQSPTLGMPTIEIDGPSFVLDNIPENSVFHLKASVPPTHRPTSSVLEVKAEDRDGVDVPVVAGPVFTKLATAFGVTPSDASGVLFAQVVGDNGEPRAGVMASSFAVDGGPMTKGPFFLDASMEPAMGGTMTSASGWVVYFDLRPGVIALRAAASANVTLDMPISPVQAGVVTVARVRFIDGKFEPPTNVSYLNQVFPIFTNRGCEACHAPGNGPGRQQGNLTLNDRADKVYEELITERPGIRVNTGTPDASLLLTMPSREEPSDDHPTVIFTGTFDPDYQLIRAWITEGARNN